MSETMTLFRAIYHINNKRHSYMRKALAKYSLSGSMHMIILHVGENENCCQDDIIEAYDIDKATISRDVRALVQRGYLNSAFSMVNRRKRMLSLTETGRELFNRVMEVSAEMTDVLTAGLRPRETASLCRLIARMENNCDLLFLLNRD